MYERSAIVLERYIEKVLKLDKENSLKRNNKNFGELIEEIESYQNVTEKELEIIQEFDDTAKEIESLQQEQEKLYKANKKLEEERTQLFTELGEDAEVLDIRLKKIENVLEKNNEKLKEIRSEFIKNLTDFSKKQKNRNKCEKARRIGEASHIGYIERMHTEFEELDVKDLVSLKDFINFEKEQVRKESLEIMIKNGKNERVPFNQDVLRRAIKVRIDIAEREADCYIAVYDKMKKLLTEQDTENIRLNKYKKTLRDTSVKLAFLNAEREYVVGFLDYERMTAISGTRAHKKMMIEACNNFEVDIVQIEKLYELILRETNNRSTKKGYNQLYNKNYLKSIEEKEKNFEQEVNNVNISMGTVINSNYWRIDGIKHVYNVFQEEVSKKFNRDLSEFQLEEIEEKPKKQEIIMPRKNNVKLEKEERFNQLRYDEEDEEIEEYEEYDEDDDYDEIDEEEIYDEDEVCEDEDDYSYDEYEDYEENEEEEDEYIDEDEYDEEEEDEIYDEEIYEEGDEEEEDEDEYDDNKYSINKPKTSYIYNKNIYAEYDEEEQEQYYNKYNKNDNYDDEDDYKAYARNSFLEDDDEYQNIYEYNYDDDEESYRKQRLRNKTVISFDDEESIDMLISNSRKRTSNRKNNSKGLFNKLFKK